MNRPTFGHAGTIAPRFPNILLGISLAALALFIVTSPVPAHAAGEEPAGTTIDLSGSIDGRGVVMAECEKPVYRFHLKVPVDKDGIGTGTILLDPSAPKFDEFGFEGPGDAAPTVTLECSLKFVKKMTVRTGPVGGPEMEIEYRLFEITGPKITSRITLSTEWASRWTWARLIVADKAGNGRVAMTLYPPGQPIPCHPGCFPAGTPIAVPGGGTKAVDALRAGDVVTTIAADGAAGQGKVAAVFTTRNRLIEVQTETGTLLTTETQPLALAAGGLRAAGELKTGDQIYTWDGRERRAVAVRSVTATGRETQVFNLVLGDPVLFVANGYLARSKPPAAATAAEPVVSP